jgi:hypothetical protein
MPPPTQKSFIEDYYKTMGLKKFPSVVMCLKTKNYTNSTRPQKDTKGKNMPRIGKMA